MHWSTKIAIFDHYLALTKKQFDMGQQLLLNVDRNSYVTLLNDAISNDVEEPLT